MSVLNIIIFTFCKTIVKINTYNKMSNLNKLILLFM